MMLSGLPSPMASRNVTPDTVQRIHKSNGCHKFPMKGHLKQLRMFYGCRELKLECETISCCRCIVVMKFIAESASNVHASEAVNDVNVAIGVFCYFVCFHN